MDSVSVIIPTFNRAHTLEKAIKSALIQSYPVLEVLVCDDGSTDNSKTIVELINDSRVKWIDCGTNGRPAIPRNRGINKAQGSWIAFLDSDDEWFPEKIKQQLAFAKSKQLKAICSNANKLNENNNVIGKYLSFTKDTIDFNDLISNNYVICSSAMIHKSLVPIIIGFPEDAKFKAVEDYALWLRVVTQTKIGYIKDPLVNYLDVPNNSIRANQPNPLKQKMELLKNLLKWQISAKTKNANYYFIVFKSLITTQLKFIISK